eukprot:TRINITY_DN3147_c0_g1_i1.p1 TRINITY_DN3147_c0_g1~~TRINITY_DN3147_c0_g1_i1.p1  ORF type:complete len:391 (-),score=103.64 TRINITY_DN3147_c0_g1_i1:33-1205(-)
MENPSPSLLPWTFQELCGISVSSLPQFCITKKVPLFVDGVAVNYTVRSPVGAAGLISPWNLPLYLLTWKIAPALAVGNTVICKPSELTSLTAWMLCKVMVEAGLPPGVCNMVFGYGAKAGAALVGHPKVPLISFTGGTKTGEAILLNSAKYFKKVSLELGGKNPNIIFDDCNFAEALATSVRSSFANQGEICLCGSRIYVQDTIYDKFVEGFVQKTKEIKVGDPTDPTTTMGALVSKEHRQKIEYYVQVAKEEGGKILTGGARPELDGNLKDGYFYQPTVIVGLGPSSRVQMEEIFGPVVTISPFKTEEEVLEYANCTEYGLSASVWTLNVHRANRVAQKLQTGTVWVNCWMVRDLRVPFGGVKSSGVGREGGAHSIDFFTEHKTICLKL